MVPVRIARCIMGGSLTWQLEGGTSLQGDKKGDRCIMEGSLIWQLEGGMARVDFPSTTSIVNRLLNAPAL